MSILPSVELANFWSPIRACCTKSRRKLNDKHVRFIVPLLYPNYEVIATNITKRAVEFDSQLIRKVKAEEKARDMEEMQEYLLRRSRGVSPC